MKKFLITALTLYLLGNNIVTQADNSDSTMNNRVVVLNAGYVQPIEGREFLPGVKDNGARKVASTISLVKAKDLVLITDPGMAAAEEWDNILNKLKEQGVKPEDVTHVFISHHHPDHTTQLGLFTNATLVDFWATYKNDLWEDHPDNFKLAPGVTVVQTPGHTDQDASLIVDTAEGTYALTHLWWSPDFQPAEDPLAENHEGIEKSRALILPKADWIVPGHGEIFKNPKRDMKKLSKQQQDIVINAVKKASKHWVDSFNNGDAAGCASAYEDKSVMSAKPFGIFHGVNDIQTFWENLIAQGYDDVRYIEPVIEVINEHTAVISSKWEMNKAHGIITKELWVLQDNGEAKLRIDNFEVLGSK